jgi:hypothetical protein
MEPYIKDQIEELAGLSRKQLLDRWQDLHGRPAPSGIRGELLIPFLAYRIQEKAYGGLSPRTRAQLNAGARSLMSAEKPGGRVPLQQMKIGTQLLRRWRDAIHVVTVTEAGYNYQGKSFRSLSEIARSITGTRWSGPAFFGLKKSSSVKSEKLA